MKQSKINWLSFAGLFLSLPTAFIITISILKYGFNVNGPFDSLQPTLESWGIKETLGLNINLLILFGPVMGFLLAILQVLKIDWSFTSEHFKFNVTVRKKWFPLLVAGFSISVLGVLLLYMIGENCSC